MQLNSNELYLLEVALDVRLRRLKEELRSGGYSANYMEALPMLIRDAEALMAKLKGEAL